jgi:raffinose/stachyose/melibiose transport system permease protein
VNASSSTVVAGERATRGVPAGRAGPRIPVPRRRRYDSTLTWKYRRSIALALAPAVAIFGTIFVVPIGTLLVTSLFTWDSSGLEFAGIENFRRLLEDAAFWAAMRVQTIWLAASTLVHVPLAVIVALILARKMPGWKVFRTVFFLPNIVSYAALAMVFVAFYNARYGMLNESLSGIGLSEVRQDWLFTPSTALAAIIATWLFHVGLFTVIIMAEIASIPESLYEAATVDGAKPWQRDLFITLPLLRTVVGTCMILAATMSLIYFEGIFLMTGGGPADATLNLPMFAYRHYSQFNWGYANAIGVVILLLGVLAILTIRRVFRVREAAR